MRLSKARFDCLSKRILKYYRLEMDEYESAFDEAAMLCSQEQFDAIKNLIYVYGDTPLTPKEERAAKKYKDEKAKEQVRKDFEIAKKRYEKVFGMKIDV